MMMMMMTARATDTQRTANCVRREEVSQRS